MYGVREALQHLGGVEGAWAVSHKTPERSKARVLQSRTGWSYSECLRCVRTLDGAAIEALILLRKSKPAAGQ